MPRLRRKLNYYGAPADFSEAKLPTHAEVGGPLMKFRQDLKAQNPSAKVSDHKIAKLVIFRTNNFKGVFCYYQWSSCVVFISMYDTFLGRQEKDYVRTLLG